MLDYSNIPPYILSKFYIDLLTGCWLWTAAVKNHTPGRDYGAIHYAQRQQSAHRVVYELCVGPIPEGLQIDHLCRTPRCVNPSHLEPVTSKENARRGIWGMKTHCPQGHPYDEANTYTHGGKRFCRKCSNASCRRWRSKEKERL